jgi:hypothetical protein
LSEVTAVERILLSEPFDNAVQLHARVAYLAHAFYKFDVQAQDAGRRFVAAATSLPPACYVSV